MMYIHGPRQNLYHILFLIQIIFVANERAMYIKLKALNKFTTLVAAANSKAKKKLYYY